MLKCTFREEVTLSESTGDAGMFPALVQAIEASCLRSLAAGNPSPSQMWLSQEFTGWGCVASRWSLQASHPQLSIPASWPLGTRIIAPI